MSNVLNCACVVAESTAKLLARCAPVGWVRRTLARRVVAGRKRGGWGPGRGRARAHRGNDQLAPRSRAGRAFRSGEHDLIGALLASRVNVVDCVSSGTSVDRGRTGPCGELRSYLPRSCHTFLAYARWPLRLRVAFFRATAISGDLPQLATPPVGLKPRALGRAHRHRCLTGGGPPAARFPEPGASPRSGRMRPAAPQPVRALPAAARRTSLDFRCRSRCGKGISIACSSNRSHTPRSTALIELERPSSGSSIHTRILRFTELSPNGVHIWCGRLSVTFAWSSARGRLVGLLLAAL